MPPVYFENAMGRILEHPSGYALLRYHPGRRSLVDVQNYLLHTGRLLHRQGWHKILSDQRLLTPFTHEEQALILDFWQARLFTFGPTVGAVLVSHNAFTRLSFNQIREQAHGALRYHLFEDEAKAAAWLAQVP